MALNVLHYRHQHQDAWGIVIDGRIIPIPGVYPTTGDFIREGAARARELVASVGAGGWPGALSARDVEPLCPITRNQQFICQATNYRQHMIESGIDPLRPSPNVFFRKASSCLAPAHIDIVRPEQVQLLDYEVELGLVIGREMTGPETVTTENLHQYVAALVITDDVSARDIQLPQGQFYKGKSYRTFGPTGPYLTLVDAADLVRFDSLRLQLWVNDELRQDALASDMVHRPPATLTELSGLQDLFPGDLIATGTPGGCASRAPGWLLLLLARLLPERVKWKAFVRAGLKNPRFLKPGDRVRVTIRSEDGAIDLGMQEGQVVV